MVVVSVEGESGEGGGEGRGDEAIGRRWRSRSSAIA